MPPKRRRGGGGRGQSPRVSSTAVALITSAARGGRRRGRPRRQVSLQFPTDGTLRFMDNEDDLRAGAQIQKQLYDLLHPPSSSVGRSQCALCNKPISFRKRRAIKDEPYVVCGCFFETVYCSVNCRTNDEDNREGHKCQERDNVEPSVIEEAMSGSTKYSTKREVENYELLSTPTDRPLLFYPIPYCATENAFIEDKYVGFITTRLSCVGCMRHLPYAGNMEFPTVFLGTTEQYHKYRFSAVEMFQDWKCSGCDWPFCSELCARGVLHPKKECRLLNKITQANKRIHPLRNLLAGLYLGLMWIPVVRIMLMGRSDDPCDRENYSRLMKLPAEFSTLPVKYRTAVDMFTMRYKDVIEIVVPFDKIEPIHAVQDILVRVLKYSFTLSWIQNKKAEDGFLGMALYPFAFKLDPFPNAELTMEPTTLKVTQHALESIGAGVPITVFCSDTQFEEILPCCYVARS